MPIAIIMKRVQKSDAKSSFIEVKQVPYKLVTYQGLPNAALPGKVVGRRDKIVYSFVNMDETLPFLTRKGKMDFKSYHDADTLLQLKKSEVLSGEIDKKRKRMDMEAEGLLNAHKQTEKLRRRGLSVNYGVVILIIGMIFAGIISYYMISTLSHGINVHYVVSTGKVIANTTSGIMHSTHLP